MGDAQVVGVVREVWRYPVKSMQGEQVTSIEADAGGVVGDRAFGVRDIATGYVLSAKAVPELFQASARTIGDVVVITLPDGTEISSGDADAAVVLSSWLGRDVVLARPADLAGAGRSIEFELRLDPADDSGELFAWPARPGTFLDSAPLHLLTTASLAAMAELRPESVWDVRRFRPNLVLDTGPGVGFVEDTWIGHDLIAGSTGASVRVEGACGRCAMPVRSQSALGDRPSLDRDVGVFRALTAEHGNTLGVYGRVTALATVTVGDEVRIRD